MRLITPPLQKIGRQAKVAATIKGKSRLINTGSTAKPPPPVAKAQAPRISSKFIRLLPTTLPMARSVRPRYTDTNEVTSSGMPVPAETMVKPMTV